jgi:hypothetical protein
MAHKPKLNGTKYAEVPASLKLYIFEVLQCTQELAEQDRIKIKIKMRGDLEIKMRGDLDIYDVFITNSLDNQKLNGTERSGMHAASS